MAKIRSKNQINNGNIQLTVKQSAHIQKAVKYRNFLIASFILNITLISYIILTTILRN